MLIESEKLIQNPKVSIVVLTYNHEQYLIECLDSVVNQDFEHEYEIIIAEDCSKDTTRDICYKYYELYPSKIRLLLQEKNKGLIANYRDAMSLCRGQYIAQCAGDDYWCDKNKLKLQYEFLENNEDFGLVRTLGYELRGEHLITTYGGHSCDIGDVKHIAIWGPLGFGASICFRKSLLIYVDFDELILRGITMEDYPMHAIFSHHTKFGLIHKRMIVYRVLEESISHTRQFEKKMKYFIGFYKCKIYIKELYGQSIPWSVQEIEDDIRYEMLRYNYLKYNYKEARNIIFKTTKYDVSHLVNFRNNVMLFYILAFLLQVKQFLR